jgi:excisionase family DNA binding protein
MQNPVRLRTQEAAEYLGVAESTMRYWRHQGIGPKSYRIGRRTFWDVADLDAFVAAQRVRTERGD